MFNRITRSFIILCSTFALSSTAILGTATAANVGIPSAVHGTAVPKSQNLSTAAHLFTTSTGAHVELSISAYSLSDDPSHTQLQVSLSTPNSGAGVRTQTRTGVTPISSEGHYWSFTVPSSGFVMKPNGNAMLTSRGVLGAYGSVTLWFTAHAHTSVACKSGPANIFYMGQVSAKVVFNSGAQGVPSTWGNINQGQKSVNFGPKKGSYLSTTYCYANLPSTTSSCYTGASWSAPTPGSGTANASLSGSSRNTTSIATASGLSVNQSEMLSYKIGATSYSVSRYDTVSSSGPAEMFKKAAGNGGAIAIKTTPGTPFSGGATISTASAAPPPSNSPCKDAHGVKKTEHQTFYYDSVGGAKINWVNAPNPYTATGHVGKLSFSTANGEVHGGYISVFSYS